MPQEVGATPPRQALWILRIAGSVVLVLEPGPGTPYIAQCGTSCTIAGNFWVDLDEAEAAHPVHRQGAHDRRPGLLDAQLERADLGDRPYPEEVGRLTDGLAARAVDRLAPGRDRVELARLGRRAGAAAVPGEDRHVSR